ncbi:MAG TPA: ABC transporter permease [Thermodesulfobacteriota bacterium]
MRGTDLLARAASVAVTLVVVSIFTFLLLRVLPGDPALLILGAESPGDTLAEMRRELGTDRPLLVQYGAWVASVARGELGISIRHRQPVLDLIIERLPVTLSLSLLALLVALAIGLPLGVVAAARRGTVVDYGALAFSQLGQAIPPFWLGIMLILAFALKLRWLPTGGYEPWSDDPAEALRSLAMPSLALGVVLAAQIARMQRSSMLDVMGEDFVRTARAKGLPESRVVYWHTLRNALIPTVTVVGLQVGSVLGGAIIIEQIFALPGLGRLVLFAVVNRDWPLIQGLVFFLAALTVVLNLLVDLSYAWLDPRTRRA